MKDSNDARPTSANTAYAAASHLRCSSALVTLAFARFTSGTSALAHARADVSYAKTLSAISQAQCSAPHPCGALITGNSWKDTWNLFRIGRNNVLKIN